MVKCLDTVGFYYRIKSKSMLKLINNEKRKYSLEYMSVKHADFYVSQFGSFVDLNNRIIQIQAKNEENLNSEKFVIDIFCKTFLGFTVFGMNKNK